MSSYGLEQTEPSETIEWKTETFFTTWFVFIGICIFCAVRLALTAIPHDS